MDTSDIITIVVIGWYTIIYLLVFLIQKSQIDSLKTSIQSNKEVVDSMKSLVGLMDCGPL